MLSSYRVVDVTDERGAKAGFALAASGADVLAVEPPGDATIRCQRPFVDGRPPARSDDRIAELVAAGALEQGRVVVLCSDPGVDA